MLTNISVAAPTANDHAATKAYVDSSLTNINGDDIQDNTIDSSEIQDNSLTSADLSRTLTYSDTTANASYYGLTIDHNASG